MATLPRTSIQKINKAISDKIDQLESAMSPMKPHDTDYTTIITWNFRSMVFDYALSHSLNITFIEEMMAERQYPSMVTKIKAGMAELSKIPINERWDYITNRQRELNHAHNPATTITFMNRQWHAFELRKLHNRYLGVVLPVFDITTFSPNAYFYIPELNIVVRRNQGEVEIVTPAVYRFMEGEEQLGIAFNLWTSGARTEKTVIIEGF